MGNTKQKDDEMNAGVYDRLKIAEEWFTGLVIETIECTQEEALKIMALYLKHKLMKPDLGINRFKLKSGAYWEKDVLLNALDMVNA